MKKRQFLQGILILLISSHLLLSCSENANKHIVECQINGPYQNKIDTTVLHDLQTIYQYGYTLKIKNNTDASIFIPVLDSVKKIIYYSEKMSKYGYYDKIKQKTWSVELLDWYKKSYLLTILPNEKKELFIIDNSSLCKFDSIRFYLNYFTRKNEQFIKTTLIPQYKVEKCLIINGS